ILIQSDRDVPATEEQAREVVRASGAPDSDHLFLSLERPDKRQVFLHELTHHFEFEMMPSMPLWAQEGLADHEAQTSMAAALITASDRRLSHAVFDTVVAEYGTQGFRDYLRMLQGSFSRDDFDQAFDGFVRARLAQPPLAFEVASIKRNKSGSDMAEGGT